MMRSVVPVVVVALSLVAACAPSPEKAPERQAGAFTERTVVSADGLPIRFTDAGRGDIALVFVHCGFCNRGFWENQVSALGDRYRVVALDLAGHGESGVDRDRWTLRAFGEDVRAVVEALDGEPVVLVGNSLGGPVSLEAAALLPERVLGIVAVDTLQDADAPWDEEAWRARLQVFRTDYDRACAQMAGSLLHPDADPALVERVDAAMCGSTGELAAEVMQIFAGYDMGAAMRRVQAPIRGINGDLFPTNVEGNRKYAPGFEALVMEGVGHFPQLERPESFNAELDRLVQEFAATAR